MANKQQTAVEWLLENMPEDYRASIPYEFAEQALAMERQQTIRFAYEQIRHVESETGDLTYRKVPEELYTETYGKESNHSEKTLEMQRPRWVQFSERKPTESKHYFVKGKGDYGGYLFYFDSLGEFELGNLPVNKFADEYLQWLEE